jgi:hypothetical protein
LDENNKNGFEPIGKDWFGISLITFGIIIPMVIVSLVMILKEFLI